MSDDEVNAYKENHDVSNALEEHGFLNYQRDLVAVLLCGVILKEARKR